MEQQPERRINVSWTEKVLYPYLIAILVLCIYFFIHGVRDGEMKFVLIIFLVVILLQYLLFTQFEITSIVLIDGKISIQFPTSLFLKSKNFELDQIEKVEIEKNPGTRYVPRIYIHTKAGLKTKCFYSGRKAHTDELFNFLTLKGIYCKII